ncbi:MAG: hypothetical protein ACXABY_28275, partial [Candidatus Thorarchaeota archaeon]
MSNSWQKAYSELKEYIIRHPIIEISKNCIAIPSDVRPEFYRQFDTVRVAFLEEKFQTLLDEAILLSKHYAEVGQELTKSLELDDIKVSANLNWFLNDPVNGLTRSLFEPLFNLLKGKVDTTTFENEALINIDNSFSKLFRWGYEKWILISLINLLTPDKAFAVPIEDTHSDTAMEGGMVSGLRKEPVPEAKETKLLSLTHIEEAGFIVSNLIVHSVKLGCYASIRTDLGEASWTAQEVSGKREWYNLREVMRQHTPVAHWPDLVIYIDDQPEDLALVADFGRFCRPDMIVECVEQADWYQQGILEKVRSNHDFFKPRLGSYLVSRLPVPEEAFKELMPKPATGSPAAESAASIETSPEPISEQLELTRVTEESASERKSITEEDQEKQPLDIHILTVAYDRFQLAPIIEALLTSEKVVH